MDNNNYYNLFFLLLFVFSCVGCRKNDRSEAVENKVYVLAKEELNVSYGSHPLQKMDIYFPG